MEDRLWPTALSVKPAKCGKAGLDTFQALTRDLPPEELNSAPETADAWNRPNSLRRELRTLASVSRNLMHASTNARIATRGHSALPPRPGRLGNWQLDHKLGEGRWTEVFQARPCGDCRHADYAVKLLKPPFARDAFAASLLQREARICSEVTHPHLISLLAAHVDHPPFYLVMPRLAGSTLRSLLDGQGRLDPPYALWLIRQAAEALDALHRRGWLHGDLKPENLFIGQRGFVTVFDLGLAKPVGQRADTLAGTPAYLPPEAFTRGESCAAASDVYSLGIALYEMLTGVIPFPQGEPEELAEAVLTHPPADPRQYVPTLSPRIVRLLRRVLAKNPLRRPIVSELIAWLIDLEIDTFADRGCT